jgi:hypothetical protein
MNTGPLEAAAPPAEDLAPLNRPRMSSAEPAEDDYNPADAYRALCTSAVAALVLGMLSVLAVLDWWLALIPLAAVILGIVALRTINHQPQEYTGRFAAIAGITLGLLFGLGGLGWLGYVQATEVPNGYDRIDYSVLQPQPGDPLNAIPPDAKALDGKKIFIKGYVYPGMRKNGITQFLLVRDQGTCCFGGDPKITDRIQVSLSNPKGFTFSGALFKVAGTLRVTEPKQAVDAKGVVFYHLDEAILP